MTCHEILGFMSPALSTKILEDLFEADKATYRAALAAVAGARRVRPVFLERQPRTERHPAMIATLARPSLEDAAGTLLRTWLLKKHTPLIADFLDALGIAHRDGVVDGLPDGVEDAKLKTAVEKILAAHPHEVVTAYLYAFNHMNDTRWANLDQMLASDPRLQLAG